MSNKVLRICKECNNEFEARNSEARAGRAIYCSKVCQGRGVNKPIPIDQKMAKYVERLDKDECWIYSGYKNKAGYGKIGTSGGKNEYAHRVMYRLEKGEIPEGMVVMHACDNPSCCNPNHLNLGTTKDNVQDMVRKGRHVSISKASKSMFSDEVIDSIRSEYTGEKEDKFRLSIKYNCSPQTIINVVNNWEKPYKKIQNNK